MFYLILNLFFSFLTIVMTGVMLFTFRKPRRITFFSSSLSALISLIIPVIFLVINNSALGNVWLRANGEGSGPAGLTELPTHDWAGFGTPRYFNETRL